MEVGACALAWSFPVVNRLEEPAGVAVDLILGEVAVGIVGEFAVGLGEAAFVAVAQDGAVGESSAPRKSAQ